MQLATSNAYLTQLLLFQYFPTHHDTEKRGFQGRIRSVIRRRPRCEEMENFANFWNFPKNLLREAGSRGISNWRFISRLFLSGEVAVMHRYSGACCCCLEAEKPFPHGSTRPGVAASADVLSMAQIGLLGGGSNEFSRKSPAEIPVPHERDY